MFALTVLISALTLNTQSDPGVVQPILARQLQSPQVVTDQLQQFLQIKVQELVVPVSATQWAAEEARILQRLLNDAVFHGWPQGGVNPSLRVEDLGPFPRGKDIYPAQAPV